jgi:hypothetical protein
MLVSSAQPSTISIQPARQIGGYTNLISTLRATLSHAGLLGVAPSTYETKPDDIGLATFSVTLGGGVNATAIRITYADATNVIAFVRNTTQFLDIVTAAVRSPAPLKLALPWAPSSLRA